MKLRPFFKYFGSKARSAHFYPEPKYGTIVEPFAGSAGYSLSYPDRNIVLFDSDPRVITIWNYLIHASPETIMALPLMEPGQRADSLNVCDEARLFISCCVNTSPFRNVLTSWKNGQNNGLWGAAWRERVASQVEAIKHWVALCCDYSETGNGEVTWFIDPPYNTLSEHYGASRKSPIDYTNLAQWCKSRLGQVVVCEQDGAKWLPFQRLGTFTAVRGSRTCEEAIWTNDDHVRTPESTIKSWDQIGMFGT